MTILSLLPLVNHRTDCKMQPDFRRLTCEHVDVLKQMKQDMYTSVCVCVCVNSVWQLLSPLCISYNYYDYYCNFDDALERWFVYSVTDKCLKLFLLQEIL